VVVVCNEIYDLGNTFHPSPPSRRSGRFRFVLPSDPVTWIVIGDAFYDYYGFICRPSALNGHISAPLRRRCRSYNAPAQTVLLRVRSLTFIAHPPPLLKRVTERIQGFSGRGRFALPFKPTRGSHQAWVATLATASFRSLIGSCQTVRSLFG
jgi:hypothetical protein